MDVTNLMTPERILGALLWSVAHGELSDELIDLVKTLPLQYVQTLEGDLDNLVHMTWGANTAPHVRPYLTETLQSELRSTLGM